MSHRAVPPRRGRLGEEALERVMMSIWEVTDITPEELLWQDDSQEFPIGEIAMSTAERLRKEGRRIGKRGGGTFDVAQPDRQLPRSGHVFRAESRTTRSLLLYGTMHGDV